MRSRVGAALLATTATTTLVGCGTVSSGRSATDDVATVTAAVQPAAESTLAVTTAPPPTTPTTPPAPPPSPPPTPLTLAPIATYSAETDVLAPQAEAAPVRVRIPSLAIDGGVIPAGVNAAGELDIPPDAKTLVWYRHGPSPGEAGSAVIAGHVDWKGVLGTFDSLAATPVGEQVHVAYDDGTELSFTVTSVELVDKPAVAVNGTFARDGDSVLRLVTCGGEFNDDTNHYLSNVIVTAVPA